jgi:drug/metabolite transporter, DME family
MLNDKTKGRLLVMAGALMWSTSGFFARAPLFDAWAEEVRGPLLAFWRAAFAALVLAPTVRRPKFTAMLIPLTFCFAVMNLTYVTAMVRTSPANAVWLQNAAPFWVFLIAVFLFREPVDRRDMIPLIFGLFGVGTILFFEIRESASYDAIGLACGVLGGITYAGVLSMMNRVSRLEAAWVVALNHGVAALFLLPWVLMAGVRPTPSQFVILAAFGAFQIGIPYCLVVRGLRSISAQEAVGIGLIEPVVMPIWVYLAWGVGTNWWTILGAVFIVGGLALRYFVLGDAKESKGADLPPSPSGRGPG